MSLENAQIIRRADGHWLEVTDPRGRHAAIRLEQFFRGIAPASMTETVILAWAAAQVRQPKTPMVRELWEGY
jgi:hypothetical protein